MERARKLISIVTPCYNEEANVRRCYEDVRAIFERELPEYDYEHIFCDNSSSDRTVALLKEIAATDPRVKIIVNSRNYGPFCSMFNGLLATRGDAAIPFVPADLQDPPEVIPQFVRHWEQGYDIVYGVRAQRQESRIMRTVRKIYYRTVSRLANINIPLNVGEFQLLDRKVINGLRTFDDYYPYLRGMIAYCGFRSVGVEYTWRARPKGLSKNRLYHLVDQGLNGLISFTNLPMRVCMIVGFFISILSLAYTFISMAITVVYWWIHGTSLAPAGIPTLIAAVFFFGGVQLFFLGVLGEYISAIHAQVRKKPLVLEAERINLPPKSSKKRRRRPASKSHENNGSPSRHESEPSKGVDQE